MRILVVATQIQLPGTHGGSTHVAELIENLSAHGPTLAIVRKGSKGENLKGVSFGTGYPFGIKHLFPWFYLPASYHAARKFEPDVIYERGSSYGLGGILSKLLGIPLLCMVLDNHFSPLSLAAADRIVATNLKLIPNKYRTRAVKVSWGANTKRFHPGVSDLRVRQNHSIPADTFIVGYAGSFKAWHGLEFLIEAAGLLRDRNVRYVLLGDGPERQPIEAAVEARGLSEYFEFIGAVAYENVPEYLAAMDCCVAPFDPQKHPGSGDRVFGLDPLKIFEYLAMKKPVVTIQAPNLQALFDDNSQLIMVPSANATALAEAIASIQDHPEKAATMATSGYNLVINSHTWQAHTEHLVELFTEMLGSPS